MGEFEKGQIDKNEIVKSNLEIAYSNFARAIKPNMSDEEIVSAADILCNSYGKAYNLSLGAHLFFTPRYIDVLRYIKDKNPKIISSFRTVFNKSVEKGLINDLKTCSSVSEEDVKLWETEIDQLNLEIDVLNQDNQIA